MAVLTHLSLFTGIGGLDLAAEAAGFTTVMQVEFADFQNKVLEKHWPDVPRWRDVKTLTDEVFYEKTGLRTVDVLSGGCPCQPFSLAGKRRGTEDDRYLWPEMCRVIRDIAPLWVVFENVYGISNMALETVCSDLEKEGYEVQPFIIPAIGVDAPHRRNRVFVVANAIDGSSAVRRHRELADASETGACWQADSGRGQEPVVRQRRKNEPGTSGVADGLREDVYGIDPSDTDRNGLERRSASPLCGGGHYRRLLRETLELSPCGKLGQANPAYIEWMMGYPQGWTDVE